MTLVATKQIEFIDGLIRKNTQYHVISQIRIDFINREIEVQISSFIKKEDVNDFERSVYISNYLINADIVDADDLIVQSWIALATVENSIFKNASLECIDG